MPCPTFALMLLRIEIMAVPDTGERPRPAVPGHSFSAAEIGALAHLYRGEVYRSTVWRTLLDSTTNWAVVTTGITGTFTSALAAINSDMSVSLSVPASAIVGTA